MADRAGEPRNGGTPSYKFLLHTFYATGHVLPMQAVAQALVRRGHEVVWLASPEQEARVVASGASFVATREVAKADKALQTTEATTLEGCAEALFGQRLLAQVADLRRVLSRFAPDCLLNDALPQGAAALHELGEVPLFATLGVVPMYLPGVGPPEPVSALGTLMRRHRWTLPVLNPQRAVLGLKPLAEDDCNIQYSPLLHIQASCPALEYHAVMSQTRYVGPLVSQPMAGAPGLPAWWDDVVHPGSRRVVAITQGTFATDPTLLLLPALAALQDDASYLLVVPSPHETAIRARLPPARRDHQNVRIAAWVPYQALLPHCHVLITNGGYGSVTQALAEGVPLVCAGTSEDKKDTAARVVHAGAGINLGTERPDEGSLRAAVKTLLEDETYRTNARWVGAELNAQGGASRACELLEEAVGVSRG